MQFDWGLVQNSVPVLAAGLGTTIKICVLAMLLGAVLGAALGLAARRCWYRSSSCISRCR
jgi:polar amino acid transport system permease protein